MHREQPIPDLLRERLPFLVDHGLIERTGRGRGVRYMLSRDLYAFLGQKGVYETQGLQLRGRFQSARGQR